MNLDQRLRSLGEKIGQSHGQSLVQMTLAQWAIALGKKITTWFDTRQGHPGIETHGILNPTADDWRARYGTNGVSIEYSPRNWAGAHAPAGNTDAPALYAQVMKAYKDLPGAPDGVDCVVTLHDLSDLDLVEGLTRTVMDLASILGIKAPDSTPVIPTPVPVVPTPVPPVRPLPPVEPVDPCASIKSELAGANQQIALLQHEANVDSADLDTAHTLANNIAKVIESLNIPVRGGGVAWNAVRKIKSLMEV